jgi:hypothetical protein
MRKAQHMDISSRVEATGQFGLVEDDRIDWPPGSRLRPPRVMLRSRSAYPVQMMSNYVTTLLESPVPLRHIVVN